MSNSPRTWMRAPMTDHPTMWKEILGSRTGSPKHRDVERKFGVPYWVSEAPGCGKKIWGPMWGGEVPHFGLKTNPTMWKENLGSRTGSPRHRDVERKFGVPCWVSGAPGCGKKNWGPGLGLRGTGMWKEIVGSRSGAPGWAGSGRGNGVAIPSDTSKAARWVGRL